MNEGAPNNISKPSHNTYEQVEETNEFYSINAGKKSEYSDLMTRSFLNELSQEEENRLNYLTEQMSRIRSVNKVQSEGEFKNDRSNTEEVVADKLSREITQGETLSTTDPLSITEKSEVETRPKNMSEHAYLKTKFFGGNLTTKEEARLNYLEQNMERLRQREQPDRQDEIREKINKVKTEEQLRLKETRLKNTTRPWWKKIFSFRR